MATIGTILIQAANQAGSITGPNAPSSVGVGAGDLKYQKQQTEYAKKNEENNQQAPKFWTAAFKKMGIQMGLAGILKQSQIFTSTVGSLFQIFGAFVDVILAPFVPLFIPAIRWLARQLPTVAKAAQWTADKLSKGVSAVWKWFFGGDFITNIKGVGTSIKNGITEFFTPVVDFFKDIWGSIKDAARLFYKSTIARIPGMPDWKDPEDPSSKGKGNGNGLLHDVLGIAGDLTAAAKEFVTGSAQNTAAAGAITYGIAMGTRYAATPAVGTAKQLSPRFMGPALDVGKDLLKKPHQTMNLFAKLGIRGGVAAARGVGGLFSEAGDLTTAKRAPQFGSMYDDFLDAKGGQSPMAPRPRRLVDSAPSRGAGLGSLDEATKKPTALSDAVQKFQRWVQKAQRGLSTAAGAGADKFKTLYDEGLKLADDVVNLAKVTPGMGVVGQIVRVGFKRVIPGIAGVYMVSETIQDMMKIIKSDVPWLGDWKSLESYKAEAMGQTFGGNFTPLGGMTRLAGMVQGKLGLGSSVSDWQDKIAKNQDEKGIWSSGKLMDLIIRGTTGIAGAGLQTFFPGLGTLAGTALYEGGRYATTGLNIPGITGTVGGDVNKYGEAEDFSDRIIAAIAAGFGQGVNQVEIR